MHVENVRHGDNVAAPICRACDWEDALFESLGGSWNRIDSRRERVRSVPSPFAPRYWRGTAIATPSNCRGWRRWFGAIAAIVAGLWSRALREGEIRRIRAAWGTIDDRTLKDIGISRLEFEYARDARPGS